jgi:hypothetical protein
MHEYEAILGNDRAQHFTQVLHELAQHYETRLHQLEILHQQFDREQKQLLKSIVSLDRLYNDDGKRPNLPIAMGEAMGTSQPNGAIAPSSPILAETPLAETTLGNTPLEVTAPATSASTEAAPAAIAIESPFAVNPVVAAVVAKGDSRPTPLSIVGFQRSMEGSKSSDIPNGKPIQKQAQPLSGEIAPSEQRQVATTIATAKSKDWLHPSNEPWLIQQRQKHGRLLHELKRELQQSRQQSNLPPQLERQQLERPPKFRRSHKLPLRPIKP